MTFLILCAATLFLYHDAAAHDYLGKAFYIPNYDLLGDNMTGGYLVFYNLSESCTGTNTHLTIDSGNSFYDNTYSFYSSLAIESSISTEFSADFTLGASLDAATKSISGVNRRVRGITYNSYSRASSDFLHRSCFKAELDHTLQKDFEALAAVVDNPSPESSWYDYKAFFTTYGSHISKEVSYGSSLYQHAFSDSKNQYTEKQLKTKACASIGTSWVSPSVKVSLKRTSIQFQAWQCQNALLHEEEPLKHEPNSMPIAVTKWLHSFYLKLQLTTQLSISYVPIWVILKNMYRQTEHFAKAINLEAYYKGYLNYGCDYITEGIVLQKFHHSYQSTPDYPIFQCSIAPSGCHKNNDCHYRPAYQCECRGDSCVRYSTKTLNTGIKKKQFLDSPLNLVGSGKAVSWTHSTFFSSVTAVVVNTVGILCGSLPRMKKKVLKWTFMNSLEQDEEWIAM